MLNAEIDHRIDTFSKHHRAFDRLEEAYFPQTNKLLMNSLVAVSSL